MKKLLLCAVLAANFASGATYEDLAYSCKMGWGGCLQLVNLCHDRHKGAACYEYGYILQQKGDEMSLRQAKGYYELGCKYADKAACNKIKRWDKP